MNFRVVTMAESKEKTIGLQALNVPDKFGDGGFICHETVNVRETHHGHLLRSPLQSPMLSLSALPLALALIASWHSVQVCERPPQLAHPVLPPRESPHWHEACVKQGNGLLKQRPPEQTVLHVQHWLPEECKADVQQQEGRSLRHAVPRGFRERLLC